MSDRMETGEELNNKDAIGIPQSESPVHYGSSTEYDAEITQPSEAPREDKSVDDWATEPHNPMNWPAWKKVLQVVMLSACGILS